MICFFFSISFFLPAGIKCPVCSKFVLPDDIECHLVMCLTKPRLSYNGKWKSALFIAKTNWNFLNWKLRIIFDAI